MILDRSADKPLLVSRNAVGRAVHDALRIYIGRGKQYSVKQVSNGTNVPDRMIEAAMANPEGTDWRQLKIEELLSIGSFLGAGFTADWMKLMQQGSFDLPDDNDPRPGDLALSASENTTEIIRRAADGEFCAADRQALKVVGQRKMTTGATLIAMANRAPRRAA